MEKTLAPSLNPKSYVKYSPRRYDSYAPNRIYRQIIRYIDYTEINAQNLKIGTVTKLMDEERIIRLDGKQGLKSRMTG
ncbi:hypothetical protein ACA29_21265 [Lederbergia galactosidilytica]|uniref:Uncharacterized protein n=1 Tax=Lederbergia galactosidilytica TaxID=217031 RepID=A0A0Q9XNG8_9BACI|nr:hypothetical protein ACA29_21265 [Lederbergia galactosidilytica]